ncbi:MAG: ATP-binding cassette domain-containing protein [Desulfocurvibacter africanus]
MSLLTVCDVTKEYCAGGWFRRCESTRVLDGVSLELVEGRCLGLVGRSGSGKSTLGRIMLGLERPDSGQVLFQGRDLHAARGEEARLLRKDLQVVFQNVQNAVNPRLTAGQIIAEPLRNFERLRGEALRERVRELLAMVGLSPDDKSKLPQQFSGGQLQRVCIARALAPQPKVVVLDEAVSSLDMLMQARILDLLAELSRQMGTTYVFVSHDIRLVLRFADSIAVLHEGRIVENSPCPRESMDLVHPISRELASAVLPAMPAVASA